jgi:hypothetical protein
VDVVERGTVVRREGRDAVRDAAEVGAEEGEQEVALGAVEVAARDALGDSRELDGAVVIGGEPGRLVDRVVERLQLDLLGVVREPLASPDAGQRG